MRVAHKTVIEQMDSAKRVEETALALEIYERDRNRWLAERADLLAKLAQLDALQRHHDLCRKALSVPDNEPMLDAIEALLERVKSARGLLEQAGYLEWDPKTLRLTKGGCEK